MTVEQRWLSAVVAVGGDSAAAQRTAHALAARYRQPVRAYHHAEHAQDVAMRADELAVATGLDEQQRALLALAALGHDVVYDGVAGEDERASAAWVVQHLADCRLPDGLPEAVGRLVEGTAAHVAAVGDVVASCLNDADLAVLGADVDGYDRYTAQVREEYRRYDDDAWRQGRSAVLRDLLARDALYALPAARERWDARARENLRRELARLSPSS